ncbi:hypothetical protein BC939DRAFT_475693 [Gamsiella multidivaricata]|uniref:uncharacterized protein n=1 Tax=Gamsiella multidivaricata TaxID=101098 RepID=UPI0022211C89|nr:uncharacterized protein BC939DRAFT_475693 [Gamsiella multidivaricata]KAG0349162.1 hypothetical protein BGZ54_004422 [Gamsiella multidivaricata]KAI7826482.1 hypothetical protein BC939DRAFT_475693 [Gamsiella multidivaricata]
MAMNVLSHTTSPSYELTMDSSSAPTANTDSTTDSTTTAASTKSGSGGLRRSNTLKAYLANKNKLKERQAINVIVDPTVLQHHGESSSSDPEVDGPSSPLKSVPTTPSTGAPLMSPLMSPVSGRRIDTDLDVLDKEKKSIEEQLATITQQLNQLESSPSPSPSPSPVSPSKEELVEKRTLFCSQLDALLQKRRELLQSWTRDYKSLKRSGSLAKRQDDLFWVTTA